MKEFLKERSEGAALPSGVLVRETIRQCLMAAVAFVMSRGTVFGSILPFGLAFAAAVPTEFLAMSAFGCCVGMILPASGGNTFRYLGALFAIVSIKALLSITTKLASKPLLCGITAGLVTCATGLVSTVGDVKGSVMAAAEAALAFGGAYFFAKTRPSLASLSKGVSEEELTGLLIGVNLFFIGAMSIAPGGVSVGRVLAVAFVLLVSRFGRGSAGAICGVVSGAAAALSSSSTAVALVFALGGLMAGLFASAGKYAQIAAVILCSLAGGVLSKSLPLTVALFIETLFGSALFLVLPKRLALAAAKLFSPPARTLTDDGMKKTVTMRLKKASGALCDVSRTVDKVANELARINTPTFDGVLHGIEKDGCAGCSLAVHCWETKKTDTVSAVMEMIHSVREGESAEKGLPEEFRGRCLRPSRMAEAVAAHYGDYASRMAAESRISDVRGVVSEQFDGISCMLADMAEELELDEAFDRRAAQDLINSLRSLELQVTECTCRIDKYGRMGVEIIANAVRGQKLNRMKLLRQAEICCERDFDPPTVTTADKKLFITLSERAELTARFGVCQLACSPSGICGDAYSTFPDGRGRAFVIVSDGMGSGGRAAVDGAMASGLMTRLLKAGFGFDCSLSILNSAMLFKSTDESLATVDLACIDLFSGKTELLKAGAAPTIVRRSGKCGVAQSTSLPAGILREVGFDRATLKLKAGDLLLMMSDGVTSDGTDWICAEAEAFEDGTAEELAERIARGAKRRRGDGRADDITVVAVLIEKAP